MKRVRAGILTALAAGVFPGALLWASHSFEPADESPVCTVEGCPINHSHEEDPPPGGSNSISGSDQENRSASEEIQKPPLDSLNDSEATSANFLDSNPETHSDLNKDNFWMNRSEEDLNKAEGFISGMADAAKEGVGAASREARSIFSHVLFKIWHVQKHQKSKEVIRRLPEHYFVSESIYEKPLPTHNTFQMVTNGPVSELFVTSLCEEIDSSGVKSVDLINHCPSIVFDKAPFRF